MINIFSSLVGSLYIWTKACLSRHDKKKRALGFFCCFTMFFLTAKKLLRWLSNFDLYVKLIIQSGIDVKNTHYVEVFIPLIKKLLLSPLGFFINKVHMFLWRFLAIRVELEYCAVWERNLILVN